MKLSPTIDTATRRFLIHAGALLVLCGALIGCARIEDGVYVPESMEYSVVQRAKSPRNRGYLAAYDSARKHDVVINLFTNSTDSISDNKLRFVSHIGDVIRGGWDQTNFPWSRFGGAESITLLQLTTDANADGLLDALYTIYYADSIVLGHHGWGYSHLWLHRFTLGREDGHYLIPLALWTPPQIGHPVLVFRKSNRIVFIRTQVVDTLFFLDLRTGVTLARRPVGACLGTMPGASYQNDSLLSLLGNHSDNGLSYGGFADSLAYLLAFRPDGSIAWADTLPTNKQNEDSTTFVHTWRGDLLYCRFRRQADGQRSTRITIRDAGTHATLGQTDVPFIMNGPLGNTLHPNGRHESYYYEPTGHLIALDSACHIRRSERMPIVFGTQGGASSAETDVTACQPLASFRDITGDGYNEVAFVVQSGQALVVDGETLQPLLTTRILPDLMRTSMLRHMDGTVGLVTQHADTITMFDIRPTPILSRILAHQDRIIAAFLLLLVLPFSAVLIWRVEYFRQLFRALVSGDDVRGVLVIRVRPVGGMLARRRGERGSPVGGAALRPNARMQAMFELDTNHADDLGAYPPVVADFAARALRSGERLREQISLRKSDATRHLVLESRTIRLLGRFHRCVVTATDITESIEAERRRTLAEREAQHQREMLTTTVKIVHDAKTPLQTARLILNAMMIDAAGAFPADADPERDEQSATIESSIAEAVDIINRCLFLAREAQSNAGLRPMSLHRAVEAWCDKTASRYGSRGFTVRNDVPEDLPTLMLDQTGLEFLLQCACDNAVQWTPHDSPEKTVRIAARPAAGAVVLEIVDTGVGMEPETVRRLLESPGFSLREMGSGLGMLIIHRVCAEHGATLHIASTLGEGTTIAISFPLSTDLTEHAS